jgi:cystathionine beta-lyase
MDFCSPPAVIDALHKRIAHGVFGYTIPPPELNKIVVAMLETEYGWSVQPQWLVWLPGLVTGFNVACRAVGEDNDAVMTATPVYPHFFSPLPGTSVAGWLKYPCGKNKINGDLTSIALKAQLHRTRVCFCFAIRIILSGGCLRMTN